MDTLISSDKLIKELRWVLESERESLELERESPEVGTNDEYIYQGAVDTLESVLGIDQDIIQNKDMLSDTFKTMENEIPEAI